MNICGKRALSGAALLLAVLLLAAGACRNTGAPEGAQAAKLPPAKCACINRDMSAAFGMRRLHGPTSDILGVWFARGGSLVLAEEARAVVSGDVRAVVWGWDVNTGAVVLKRVMEPGPIQFPRCAVGNRLVAATPKDRGPIDIWRVDGDSDSVGGLTLPERGSGTGPLAMSSDDATVAMKQSAQIVLWNASSGGKPIKLVPHRTGITCADVRFSTDGKLLVFGGYGVGIIDLASGALLGSLRSHFHEMDRVAICGFGDKYLIAGGGGPGQLSVWGLEEDHGLPGHLLWSAHQGQTSSLAFTPDAKYLVVGGLGVGIVVRDAFTGSPVGRLGQTEGVIALAFSRNGTKLASGGSDGEVILWDWPAEVTMAAKDEEISK
ncbi:MAG: WD40 repeat domain-containing protein [Planctomycetota bacterium]|jgi:WD40 repeat protein